MAIVPTPRSVDLEFTSRCNAHCAYCYYKDNEGVGYEDLPIARWVEFMEELGRAQVLSVCIAGGEALVRDDFGTLLEAIVRNRMRFRLLTNGLLMTPAVARLLRETERCDSVQVSLDGSHAETHDSARGEGSFEGALGAIRTLVAEGVPTTVRVTIHSGNVEDLPAVAELLLEQIGLPGFSTNAASALGTLAKYPEGLFLTPAQRLRAMQILGELDEKYPGRIQADAGPLAEWRMWREMEAHRISGEPMPGRGFLTACGCVFDRLAVRADGAYVPCVMLPHLIMGTIGSDDIREVWQKASAMQAMRDRRQIPLDSFAECEGCEYIPYCTGNCPGTACSLVGDPHQPSPESCLRRFKLALKEEGLSLW
jgi:SynChlorMet cassette radical SAM/SPASM protein ScmE